MVWDGKRIAAKKKNSQPLLGTTHSILLAYCERVRRKWCGTHTRFPLDRSRHCPRVGFSNSTCFKTCLCSTLTMRHTARSQYASYPACRVAAFLLELVTSTIDLFTVLRHIHFFLSLFCHPSAQVQQKPRHRPIYIQPCLLQLFCRLLIS